MSLKQKTKNIFFRSNKLTSLFWNLFLFIIIIGTYFVIAHERHLENPQDKLMPSFTQIAQGIKFSFSPDQNGQIPLIVDTYYSLSRLFIGLISALLLSLIIGIGMGFFEFFDKIFNKFITYFGKIPPLALLPILFIIAGLGESTKIILIIIGLTPVLTLDVYMKIKALPPEHFIKAITLGSHSFKTIKTIILPQIIPSVINSLRINLLSAWMFLIAAESISAQAGLGYRIFVVRRYLAMDIIIPYVLWIALISFLLDLALNAFIKNKYPWFNPNNNYVKANNK